MSPEDSEARGITGLAGKLISSAATILIVGLLLVYVWHHRAELSIVLSVQWPFLVCIAALRVVLFMILGLQRRLLYRHFGAKLVFQEWFGLTVLNNLASYFVPMHGGVALSAAYLKRVHGFPFSLFASVLFAAQIWGFFVSSSVGVCVCVALYLSYGIFDERVLVYLSVVGLTSLGALMIPLPPPMGQNRYLKALRSAIDGWSQLKGNRPLFLKMSALLTASLVAQGTMLLAGYAALSIPVDLLPVLLVAVFAQCTVLIKITPGNLGVTEVAIAVGSEAAGIGFDRGLAVAAVIRAVLLVVVFGLGGVFTYLLSKTVGANVESAPDLSALNGR